MVGSPESGAAAPQLIFLREQVASRTDRLFGEITDDWQEMHYGIPGSLVEMWEAQPFRERLPKNLAYKLFIDTRLEQIEETTERVRRFELRSDYVPDASNDGGYLQWDWVMELSESGEPRLSSFEWNHHFSNSGNSGANRAHLYREATTEDVEAFSRFLVGTQLVEEAA